MSNLFKANPVPIPALNVNVKRVNQPKSFNARPGDASEATIEWQATHLRKPQTEPQFRTMAQSRPLQRPYTSTSPAMMRLRATKRPARRTPRQARHSGNPNPTLPVSTSGSKEVYGAYLPGRAELAVDTNSGGNFEDITEAIRAEFERGLPGVDWHSVNVKVVGDETRTLVIFIPMDTSAAISDFVNLHIAMGSIRVASLGAALPILGPFNPEGAVGTIIFELPVGAVTRNPEHRRLVDMELTGALMRLGLDVIGLKAPTPASLSFTVVLKGVYDNLKLADLLETVESVEVPMHGVTEGLVGLATVTFRSPKRPSWEDLLDFAKLVDFISTGINSLKPAAVEHEAEAKIAPNLAAYVRLVWALRTTDGKLAMLPAVQALLSSFLSPPQEFAGRLADFCEGGVVPSSDPPPNWIDDFIGPRVLLPLYRRHYLFFRSLVLSCWVFFVDFERKNPNVLQEGFDGLDRVQRHNLVTVILSAQDALQIPAYSASMNDTILMRISSDVAFLDSLAVVGQFAVFHYIPFYQTEDDDYDFLECGEKLFSHVVNIICNSVALNPSFWIKFQKEFYRGESKQRTSPVFKLRRIALDFFAKLEYGKLMRTQNANVKTYLHRLIVALSVLLGEQAITIVEDGSDTFTFEPLPKDYDGRLPFLAAAAHMPEELFQARKTELRDYCDHCGSSANLKRCSRCLAGRFCSADCQRAGFKEHQKLCFDNTVGRKRGAAAAFNASPMPEFDE